MKLVIKNLPLSKKHPKTSNRRPRQLLVEGYIRPMHARLKEKGVELLLNKHKSRRKQSVTNRMSNSGSTPIKVILPNGMKVYLYPRKYLAATFGVPIQTIVSWEFKKLFPKTCFIDEFGLRLYSLEHIRVCIYLMERWYDDRIDSLAAKGKRMKNEKPMHDAKFVRALYLAFIYLEKYFKGEKDEEEIYQVIGVYPYPKGEREFLRDASKPQRRREGGY